MDPLTTSLPRDEFMITVDRSLGHSLDDGGEWDQLLARSHVNTIFLSSPWLRAWIEAYGDKVSLLIPKIRRNGELVAAALFCESNGAIEFAGKSRSDYLDILLSRELGKDAAARVTEALFAAVQNASTSFRCFQLDRIPLENGTVALLQRPGSRYFVIQRGTEFAFSMDMSAAPLKLQKKSLRRHELGLARQGEVRIETFSHADDILPRLDQFFDQHIRRWRGSPYPSLFLDDRNREFYRAVTRNLDHSGWLRFTEVCLDGRLVAAHFGFFHAQRFTWYKPTYEPEMARYSPGEVLLKRLIEGAQIEHAAEFDFTIGDEAFKHRFATKAREIGYIHVTNSRISAWRLRARLAITGSFRAALGTKLWGRLRHRS